ncbi:MAG: carbonic anhydrase [Deltaproteobacteria bacterium]|nr:carbonic anhydrase [Deltaproteobacteria bacterium]
MDNVMFENVRRVMAQLKDSKPVLHKMVQEGKLKIAGAVYDLETGLVKELE